MIHKNHSWLEQIKADQFGGSKSVVDFLPSNPKPGQWGCVEASTPVSIPQLNEATDAGWDMVSMVPLIQRTGITYVLYFQYKGAFNGNSEYRS